MQTNTKRPARLSSGPFLWAAGLGAGDGVGFLVLGEAWCWSMGRELGCVGRGDVGDGEVESGVWVLGSLSGLSPEF